jgi:hypothetical protein
LDVIDFHSIYEGLLQDSSLSDNDIKMYHKYKTTISGGGQALRPKKKKGVIKPDKKSSTDAARNQDAQVAKSIGDKKVKVKQDALNIDRTQGDMLIIDTVNNKQPPLVLVSGVKYCGKSTLSLKIAEELMNSGLPSLVIDASGRRGYIQRRTPIQIVRGSKIFDIQESPTVAVQLLHASPTVCFLSSLEALSYGKVCVICEIDLKYVQAYIDTFVGTVVPVFVTEYDFLKLLDLADWIKQLDIQPVVCVNVRNTDIQENSVISVIKDMMPTVKDVVFITDIYSVVTRLGVC